jgi:hypothetical protein
MHENLLLQIFCSLQAILIYRPFLVPILSGNFRRGGLAFHHASQQFAATPKKIFFDHFFFFEKFTYKKYFTNNIFIINSFLCVGSLRRDANQH